MYNKILIPVALDHGHTKDESIAVAKALSAEGAELILLSVIEDIPAYVTAEIPAEVFRNVHAEVEAALKSLASTAGPRTRSEVVRGHPGVTIVDYAKKHGVDCIVVASHRPEWSDYLIGSTAARVVRHAPCAVHVTR